MLDSGGGMKIPVWFLPCSRSRRWPRLNLGPATWAFPFDGAPGALNAITDVKGVEVGHTTSFPAAAR